MPLRGRLLFTCVLAPAVMAGCDVTEPDRTPAFAMVAVGARHGCALDTNGRAYCWGDNRFGQLGTGDTQSRLTATPVQGERRFRAIDAAQDRTCALDVIGRMYCWGLNDWGQLGDGSMVPRSAPVPVRFGMRFVELSLGWEHTCGLRSDDSIHCWGRSNMGQTGTIGPPACGPGRSCNRLPVRVPGEFTQVQAGLGHTCGLRADGRAVCWGWNFYGQLGDGSDIGFRTAPAPIAGDHEFVRLIGGTAHTCGQLADGRLLCWGSDLGTGGMGDGALDAGIRPVPVPVADGRSFQSVVSSKANTFLLHTCGVDTAGDLWCWGSNDRGQLGTGAALETCQVGQLAFPCTAAPVRAEIDLAFQDLELGLAVTCGLTRGGEAWCWGTNDAGQQGNGRIGDVDPPSRVLFPGEQPVLTGRRTGDAGYDAVGRSRNAVR